MTIRFFLCLIWIGVAIGCSPPTKLAQTPNILRPLSQYPDADLPDQLRKTQSTVYFVTDR
ncbi:MAG: hypothetical protein QNK92_04680 [Amylibacter sp.]